MKNMIKKMLILTAAMLFSENLFCDIMVTNESQDPVIVYVEGVTKLLQPGEFDNFKVTIKRGGKSMDGLPCDSENARVKWIRLIGPIPVAYRTNEIGKSSHLIIKPVINPSGVSYLTPVWVGILTTDKYEEQMKVISDKIREAANLNFREKDYVIRAEIIKQQLNALYLDLAKTDITKAPKMEAGINPPRRPGIGRFVPGVKQ